jgi:hypothetical protein
MLAVLAPPALQVPLALLGIPALPASRGLPEDQDPLVLPAPPEILGRQDPLAQSDLRALLARKDRKDHRALLDSQESKVQKDQPGRKGQLESST